MPMPTPTPLDEIDPTDYTPHQTRVKVFIVGSGATNILFEAGGHSVPISSLTGTVAFLLPEGVSVIDTFNADSRGGGSASIKIVNPVEPIEPETPMFSGPRTPSPWIDENGETPDEIPDDARTADDDPATFEPTSTWATPPSPNAGESKRDWLFRVWEWLKAQLRNL